MPAHELWESKFRFRAEMLPGFLEDAFGRKVRRTFFRRVRTTLMVWLYRRSSRRASRSTL